MVTNTAADSGREQKHSRRRLAMAAFVGAICLAGLTTLATSAVFKNTQTVGDNLFSTGSVKLALTDKDDATANAILTMPAMVPGDKVTAPLKVANVGTVQLRYSMTSVVDDDTLSPDLNMTIKIGLTNANCTDAGFTDGTVLYTTGLLGSVTPGTNIIGDPTEGDDSGDRTLDASNSEVLCFQVQYKSTASDPLEDHTSTTATFTFAAEQTANNS